MKAIKFLKSDLSKQTAQFFMNVVETYGTRFSHISYTEIGIRLGMSHETARLHFKSLAKSGCVTIKILRAKTMEFRMNVERFNEYFA